jgi:SagB-type dehydrogenase family enzyme
MEAAQIVPWDDETLRREAKLYPAAGRPLVRRPYPPAVALPRPELPEVPLADAVLARRSTRTFGPEPVDVLQVATLLHAAYGITHTLDRPDGVPIAPLRAVPSGGALYPLDLYVLASRVTGLDAGLYRFDPPHGVLEVLRTDDPMPALLEMSTDPEIVAGSAVTFLVTLVGWRTRLKDGARGYRFALLEAGGLMQNLLLTAAALGLGAVPLGGFHDCRADDYLGLDGLHESTLYSASVGSLPESDR